MSWLRSTAGVNKIHKLHLLASEVGQQDYLTIVIFVQCFWYYHLIVAFIDEGIRFTYAISIFEDVAYIAEDFRETNLANIGLKRKIDSILIDYRKKIQEKF